MQEDRDKWNQRYQAEKGSGQPSKLVTGYTHLAKRGQALDIACGNGRNSLYLSELGFCVDAVDISNVAVNRLKNAGSAVNAMCVDLNDWQIPPMSYDLIINIRFLDRKLFPAIFNGLKPGGLLLFESFVSQQADDAYCLAPNELLTAFSDLYIRFYEEIENTPESRFKITVRMVAQKR